MMSSPVSVDVTSTIVEETVASVPMATSTIQIVHVGIL